jgi:DNA-binding transcriptional LysR family regulator
MARARRRARGRTVNGVLERLEIESFLMLAEELHFGRTAERLGVSRARVSQTIGRLERRVGAPLFERTSRRVALTPLGRRLLADLEPGYRLITQGFANARAAARGVEGVLPVGYLGQAAAEFVLDVVPEFTRRHRGTDIQIHETQIKDMFGPLRSGLVDVLMTQFPVAEADLVRGPVLLRVPRMLAVPANHTLAKRETASVEDLARDRVFACLGDVPEYWQEHLAPSRTPGGLPVGRDAAGDAGHGRRRAGHLSGGGRRGTAPPAARRRVPAVPRCRAPGVRAGLAPFGRDRPGPGLRRGGRGRGPGTDRRGRRRRRRSVSPAYRTVRRSRLIGPRPRRTLGS